MGVIRGGRSALAAVAKKGTAGAVASKAVLRCDPWHWCLPLGLILLFGLLGTSASSSRGAKMDHLQILDGLLRKDYDRRATPTNQFNNATTVICELYIRSFGSISPVKMITSSHYVSSLRTFHLSPGRNLQVEVLSRYFCLIWYVPNAIRILRSEDISWMRGETFIKKQNTEDYEVDLYLRQKWQDERLKHAEITEALDLNDPNLVKAIWKPEVYFPNAKHAEFQYVTVPNVLVRINPDGGILYMLRLKLTFSCMMDLAKFPLDSQICTMEVASFSKTTEELRLEWKNSNPVIMGKGLRMPQFEIVDILASDCQESFQIGNYSCLVAEFYLSRSVGFHLVQSYLPTLLIVVISWVSFWMDVDSVPGRTTLGVTTLLAVSSQSSGIQSGLPQVSYIKAIDVWMGTCSAFVFCALLEFTIVNYMWRRQPDMQYKAVAAATAAAAPGAGGLVTPASVNGDAPPSSTKMRRVGSDPSVACAAGMVEVVGMVPCYEAHLPQLSPYREVPISSKLLARKIDEWSRLGFPLFFATFNLVYWPYYMLA